MTNSPTTRQCGDCALCCHLGEIVGFKPYNQWCTHCSTHQRCDIYESRPTLCRTFHCQYLLGTLGDHWYPLTSHMIVSLHTAHSRMTVLVDPEAPLIWREAPYLAELQSWASAHPVSVMVERRVFAVYPNHIEDLGELAADERIEITETTVGSTLHFSQKRVSNPDERIFG